MPPAAYLTWYQEKSNAEVFSARDMNAVNDLELNNNYQGNDPSLSAAKRESTLNESLAKRFTIDTVNIKGMIRVSVMTEGLTKAREVAYVELPVFNLLDCCLVLEDHPYYDRWFPLLVTSESLPIEGNMDRLNRQRMSEQAVHSAFEYQPCIRLRIRWDPSQDVQSVEDSKLYARVQVPCLSVGVVDSIHAREVMLAAVRGVEFRHAVATDYTDSALNVTWLQVDNELPDPVAPVILSPTQHKHPQPAVRLRIRKKNLLSQSKLNSFERIELIVQELDLRLEQQTVVATWELVKSLLQEKKYNSLHGNQPRFAFSDSNYANQGEADGNTMDTLGFATCNELVHYELLPTLESAANFSGGPSTSPLRQLQRDSMSSDFSEDGGGMFSMYAEDDVSTMYIEAFSISPIKLNVSFITTPQIMAPSHKRKRDSDIRNAGTVGLYSSLSLFFWQVGEVVLNLTSTISDAPIYFNGFFVPHMFKTESDVAKILQDHYLHSALGQLYKIVGSLELVGNPIGLLSSLGTGVKDFFYEPAHALFTSPTEVRKLGRTVIKGTMSLISNTTDGFLGTGVNITRSIGRGVAKLSMDNAYMMKREDLMRPPTSLRDAALRPARDLGVGFYYGIVGVVKVPYNSVQRHGAKAFIPGVAKGIVGLAANPVVGVLDAVAHSGDAVRNIVKIAIKENMHPVQRLRLSEVFGPDGRILPYSYENAIGTQILHALDRSNEERIKVSSAINGGVGLLLSAGSYLNPLGEDVAMTRAQKRFGGLSHMNSITMAAAATTTATKRRSGRFFSRQGGEDEARGAQGDRTGMVLRRNRFSYVAPKSAADVNLHSMLSADAGADAAAPRGQRLRRGEGSINPLNAQIVNDAVREADEEGDSHRPISARNKKAVKEYVVYTALVRQDASMDLVAVLSTDRLVVTEYHHNKHGSFLRELWHSSLDQLQEPRFERSGGKATLLLRSLGASISTFAAASARRQSFVGSGGKRSTITEVNGAPTILESLDFSALAQRNYNYLLVANYNEEDVIINMFNCVHVLLGAYNSVIPTYNPEHSVCTEDDQGIIHIGPWQFAHESSAAYNCGQSADEQMDSSAEETQAIIKELELEKWVHSALHAGADTSASSGRDKSAAESSSSSTAAAPHWLIAEQEAAVESHASVREIFQRTSQLLQEYTKSPRSKAIYKDAIDDLFKGRISYEEFLQVFEALRGSNDESSSTNSATLPSKLKRLGKKQRKRSLFFNLGIGGDDGKDDEAATVRSADSQGKRRSDSEDGSTIAKGVGSVITKSAKGLSAAVAFTNRRFSDIMFARGTASTPIQEDDAAEAAGHAKEAAEAEHGAHAEDADAAAAAAAAEAAAEQEAHSKALQRGSARAAGAALRGEDRHVSNRVPFRAIRALTCDTSSGYFAPPKRRAADSHASVDELTAGAEAGPRLSSRERPSLDPRRYSTGSTGSTGGVRLSGGLDGWEAAVRLSNHLKAMSHCESGHEDAAMKLSPDATPTSAAATDDGRAAATATATDGEGDEVKGDEEGEVLDTESSPGHTVVRGAGAEVDSDFFSYSHLDVSEQQQLQPPPPPPLPAEDAAASHSTSGPRTSPRVPSSIKFGSSKSSSFRVSGAFKPINLTALAERQRSTAAAGGGGASADASPLADSLTPSPLQSHTADGDGGDGGGGGGGAGGRANWRISGRFQPLVAGSNPLFRQRSISQKHNAAGGGKSADQATGAPPGSVPAAAAVESTQPPPSDDDDDDDDEKADGESTATRRRANRQSHRFSASALAEMMNKRVSTASTVASMLFSNVTGGR